MLAKRIVRSIVLGSIAVVTLIFVIVFFSIGNGEDWSLLSEQQFQASYPEHDYVSDYFVPVISKLTVQAAIVGGIVGAAFSLIKWAFSSET